MSLFSPFNIETPMAHCGICNSSYPAHYFHRCFGQGEDPQVAALKARVAELEAELAKRPSASGGDVAPARMDAPGVPTCGCGKPSRHESGWCGECRRNAPVMCACHDDGPAMADGRCATCLLPTNRPPASGGDANYMEGTPPCSPSDLVQARFDRVHKETGRSRPARVGKPSASGGDEAMIVAVRKDYLRDAEDRGYRRGVEDAARVVDCKVDRGWNHEVVAEDIRKLALAPPATEGATKEEP